MAEHCYCHNCRHWLFPPAIGSAVYKEHGDCLAKGRGAVSDPTYSCEQWGAKPVCGYCHDCKWWSEFTPEKGNCILTDSLADDADTPTLAVASAMHDEACLVTRPTFGCVQWEAKDG